MSLPEAEPTLPWLTTEQMIEVDRLMIEEYRIGLVQMMENAGRGLALLARDRFLDGNPAGRRVIALAGPGGNGGGALVAARRLRGWGADVEVALATAPEAFTPVPAHQLDIVRRLGVPVHSADQVDGLGPADLVLDGVIGYSLRGAPRDGAATLVQWAQAQAAPILALDAPSGLDTTTGIIHEPAIRATATLTLALPKEGLRHPGAVPHVGELYLADISVPPSLYAEPSLGLEVGALFARSDVLRLRG